MKPLVYARLFRTNRICVVSGLLLTIVGILGTLYAMSRMIETFTIIATPSDHAPRAEEVASGVRPGAIVLVGAAPLLFLGAVMSLAAMVTSAKLLYQSWKAIQDGHERTTPAKAVALMFLPLVNIYWVFVAYAGLATDINQYLERHGIAAPPANTRLGIVLSLSGVLNALLLVVAPMSTAISIVTFSLSLVLSVATVVVYLLFMASVSKAITAILGTRQHTEEAAGL